jgi:hypothetical protein
LPAYKADIDVSLFSTHVTCGNAQPKSLLQNRCRSGILGTDRRIQW